MSSETSPARVGAPGTGLITVPRPAATLRPSLPVTTRPGAEFASRIFPFDRSGLSLDDILGTSDEVVQRMRTPSLELSVRLEAARGLFQRRLPSEVLAALDGVWESASGTEQAWYLRSGAMLMLGLSLESEQLAEAAIERRPKSVALRWIQSLARLATGDVAGSRAALEVALQQLPDDELLLLQKAILSSRQKLGTPAPGSERSIGLAEASIDANVVSSILDALERRPTSATDSLGAMLWRFGARVALLPAEEVARDARAILRAMSSNGSLSGSLPPSVLHTARLLVLEIATQLEGKSENPVRGLGAQVQALLATLRNSADNLPEASSGPGNVGALLRAITEGGKEGRELLSLFSADQSGPTKVASGDRLLLEDSALTIPFGHASGADRSIPITDPSVQLRLGLRFLDERELGGGHVSTVKSIPSAASSGRGVSGRILVGATALLGALALATGHPIVCAGLAAVSGWLFLRLSPTTVSS